MIFFGRAPLGLHAFATELADVGEGVGIVDALDVVEDVVLLHVGLPADGAGKVDSASDIEA